MKFRIVYDIICTGRVIIMSTLSEIKTYITPEQCRQAAAFPDDRERLIQFLIASYNDYVKQHSEANLSVITNPDALFRTKCQEDKLVYELGQYIRDVLGLPHKEKVQNGNNRSQTTKAKTTKNPR